MTKLIVLYMMVSWDINTCRRERYGYTGEGYAIRCKDGNHDLQPVSVVLKQSTKAHILYSTRVGGEFGAAYEIVISRSRLLRAFGAQASSPTIFSPSEIVSVSGV